MFGTLEYGMKRRVGHPFHFSFITEFGLLVRMRIGEKNLLSRKPKPTHIRILIRLFSHGILIHLYSYLYYHFYSCM